ncbi:hypothetical protein VAEKB19_920001 [Vibrio aestuarianus]|nr:hypothetical protein VAEKB19_920001 [Vibrio aestuarianus]
MSDPLPDLALLRQEICQYHFWLLLGYVYWPRKLTSPKKTRENQNVNCY